MTERNTKNLSKRMIKLEKIAEHIGERGSPGLFDDAIIRWGPIPDDLLADLEAIPAQTLDNPFISADDLEICNRAAKWIATGEQQRVNNHD